MSGVALAGMQTQNYHNHSDDCVLVVCAARAWHCRRRRATCPQCMCAHRICVCVCYVYQLSLINPPPFLVTTAQAMSLRLAVAYVRTSSLTNVGFTKDSSQRQRLAITACAAHMGFHVAGVFEDPGVSGTDEVQHRPGFQQLMQFCSAGCIKTIIFEDASRFARDLLCQEIAYKHLRESGFDLVSSASPQQFLEDGLTARMVRQILGAVAEFQKSELVHRLKGARVRSAVIANRTSLKGTVKPVGRRSYLFGVRSRTIKLALATYTKKTNLERGDLTAAIEELFKQGIATSGGHRIAPRIASSWIGRLRMDDVDVKAMRLKGKQRFP